MGSDEVRSGQILETRSSQIRHVISSPIWCVCVAGRLGSKGGGGVAPPNKGGSALEYPPLGLLGKGRDRGQGRLVEGERGRERERDRQRPPSETMMLYLALKRSVTLNREVTSKALD